MMQLKNYQLNAVERLLRESYNLLKSDENEVLVLQAPTGSGKTIIIADYLRQLATDDELDKKFAFIWVSVRRLHDQSKDKLEYYYEVDRSIKCSYFEELEDKRIGENEILFLNWQSINKKDINIFVKENEQDNNLNSVIQNTKEDGREIILIIDESHHTASSEKSRELIEIISPKLTIEVSATPQLKENASSIKVNLSDVKEEEMIKNDILVNPEFMNIKLGAKSADELVIEQALKKREELLKMYIKEGSKINPLVLIQLPDKKQDMDDKKDEVIKILDEKFGLNEKNGKVAIWLSEDKSDTLPNIEKNDNEVQVLIFKQAIALGWDCPRASILVIFRESKSFTFTIQTVGRIMRMAELKHYMHEEELNTGFIFTNLPTIEITEDYVKDYISIYESKRNNEIYNDLELKSIFLRRKRERTRLSGEFVKIFSRIAKEFSLKEKTNINPSSIANTILADGKIINIDKKGEIEHGGTISVNLSEVEVQVLFDNFIKSNCSPFAPSDSSDRMKTALYQFFNKEFGFEKYDPRVQRVVLGAENAQLFVDVINLAKEKYKTEVVQQINESRELEEVEKWEVPVLISYTSRFEERNPLKSIMKPFYIRKLSEPEVKFIELLEASSAVTWWFKNGESEIKYFAVPYEGEDKYLRAFYTDFVVQFKDGRIGLFDPKEGRTAEDSDAAPKADALHKYINEENSKGMNLWGGLVIYENGTWRYNDEDKYHYNPNDLSNWKILTF